jgi:hypothetical protein
MAQVGEARHCSHSINPAKLHSAAPETQRLLLDAISGSSSAAGCLKHHSRTTAEWRAERPFVSKPDPGMHRAPMFLAEPAAQTPTTSQAQLSLSQHLSKKQGALMIHTMKGSLDTLNP